MAKSSDRSWVSIYKLYIHLPPTFYQASRSLRPCSGTSSVGEGPKSSNRGWPAWRNPSVMSSVTGRTTPSSACRMSLPDHPRLFLRTQKSQTHTSQPRTPCTDRGVRLPQRVRYSIPSWNGQVRQHICHPLSLDAPTKWLSSTRRDG